MANNCSNSITILGNKEEISDFKKLLIVNENLGQNRGFDIYQILKQDFPSPKSSNDARWFEITFTLWLADMTKILIRDTKYLFLH